MKLVKACMAMAAFAALLVVPSVASAALQLTHPTGTAPLGTSEGGNFPLIATNVAHASHTTITVMKTSIGNVECDTATITGDLYKNSGGIVEGTITTAEFWATPDAASHPEKQHCKGGFGGNTTVTPSHTSDAPGSLPWCMKAEAENVFSVRGGACTEAARALKFSLHTTTLGTCSYQKTAALTGTYTTHPSSDAIVTVNGGPAAKFEKTGGSAFCPGSGELFMAFTLTTDNSGVSGTPVYID